MAVVGLGRAGRARLRAAEGLDGVEVAAVVTRGRDSRARPLEAVLADASVDAICVCTPNLHHAGTVRRALEAGKHALVEYPLAATAAEGRSLFERADGGGRVLHVEHIELLSPSQEAQRERVSGLGRLVGGRLRFSGGGEGWIADPSVAGTPALRAVARLHRLVDLFGEGRVESARLEQPGPEAYRLEVALRFGGPEGSRVELIEERGPARPRETEWDLRLEGGRLDTPRVAPPRDLFLRDLQCFVDRVRRDAPPYVSRERILHVLDLVGAIESATAAR